MLDAISTETRRWTYTGNGVTTAFAYNNYIVADSDLDVYLELIASPYTQTLQTLTTDYTVSGEGTIAGGNVTFLSAPSSAYKVVIVSKVPNTQPSTFNPRRALSPDALTAAYHRLAAQVQQLQAKLDRTVRLGDGDSQTLAAMGAWKTFWGKILSVDAAGAIAALDAVALPTSLAGNALDFLRVNAGETAYEFRTPAQARADIGADNASNLASGTVALARLAAALQYLGALTPASDRLPYFDGGSSAALATFTAFARTLLDDADAATARATLGLLSMAVQAASAVAITGGTITGMSTPSGSSDVANKAYVDAAIQQLGTRGVVRLASTANVALASGLANGQTIDGVTIATGNFILLKNQTAPAENGIYVAPASGAAARAPNYDTYDEIAGGNIVVQEGTANADTFWLCTSNAGGTLETTAIAYSQVSPGVTLPVPISQGGTGASTAANARIALGFLAALDTLWTATTFANARSALGLVIGTDVLAPSGVGSGLSGILKQGLTTIWVPAAAMTARTTNGAAAGQAESTTNKVNSKSLDFDTATQEFAQFAVRFPKNWNEGTVTFAPIWSATSGSGGVVWALQGIALSDDDALDTAFGTEQTSTDTLITANDVHVGPTSAAITINGTPAAGDWVDFQIKRNVSDGSDTLGVDARLLGVALFFTTNEADDT